MTPIRRAVLASAVAIAAIAPSASAQIFNFDNLTSNPVLPSGFLPTSYFICTGGDLCSSDVDANDLSGSLHYVSGAFAVTVTGFYRTSPLDPYTQVAAMQDREDGYNGLFGPGAIGAGEGVYHQSGNTSDDNITNGEKLHLSFNTVVTLDWIGLHSEGHNVTGWTANATYQYSVDDVNWTTALLPANNGKFDFGPDLVTKDLYVRFDDEIGVGHVGDQFYLSGAAIATPEPSTIALMGLGLAGLGAVARRRRSA